MENLRLWENRFFKKSNDVVIYFNGSKYILNKQVLLPSRTLQNLLGGGFKESFEEEINLEIEEISINTWELLLNYIYDKHLNFYNQTFELDIEYNKFPNFSTFKNEDIIQLYIASDYFDVHILTDTLKNYIIDIIYKLLKTTPEDTNNDQYLAENIYNVSYIAEYLMQDDIINSAISKLKIDNIIELMNLCTNKDNYFCNNILFYKLQKIFNIPDKINNLQQLTQYLQPKLDNLDNSLSSLSSLYNFTDIVTKQILLYYFLLAYPNISTPILVNKINAIIKTVKRKYFSNSTSPISNLIKYHSALSSSGQPNLSNVYIINRNFVNTVLYYIHRHIFRASTKFY